MTMHIKPVIPDDDDATVYLGSAPKLTHFSDLGRRKWRNGNACFHHASPMAALFGFTGAIAWHVRAPGNQDDAYHEQCCSSPQRATPVE
jgi:hypothetical protein